MQSRSTSPTASVPNEDFVRRSDLGPELRRAFDYSLNAIGNGWKTSDTLERTTEALLEEVTKSPKLIGALQKQAETVAAFNDPRVRYQTALALNSLIGGRLSARIMSPPKLDCGDHYSAFIGGTPQTIGVAGPLQGLLQSLGTGQFVSGKDCVWMMWRDEPPHAIVLAPTPKAK